MPTAFFEGFETDGNGTRYTTSMDEFLGGGRRGANDFFSRTDDTSESGTAIAGSYGNTDGSWFAVADFDGGGNATQSETMTFSDIDISGLTDLNFGGSFASFFNFSGFWDANTQVFFEVSIDGGSFEKVLQFASVSDQRNQQAALDTDLDGIGDGAVLGSDFADFSTAISGTGSTLDLRVTFENLTQGGEDFHMDNLEITGTSTVDLAVDDMSTSAEGDTVFLDLLANDGIGAGSPVTILSGGGAGIFSAVTVTSADGREGSAFFADAGTLNFAFDPLGNFDDLDAGETDTVTISYTVTDGNGETDTAEVVLTIEGEAEELDGDETDNNLDGTAGNDVINGNAGNDTIDGGAGSDTMDGGTGNDIFFVDDAGDVVVEAAGEGYDRVNTTITHTLAENVEMATARGTADIDLTGNDGNNWLNGNAGSNVLTGLAGNDRLQGKAGADTLDGGTGNDNLFGGADIDTFVFADGDGSDVIWDFEDGEIINLAGTSATSFDDLDIFDAASGANIDYGTGVVVVSGVTTAEIGRASCRERV